MPEIREMDAIIPEDIEYRFRGKTYVLPGDIDVEHTYQLLDLLQKAAVIEEAILKAAADNKPFDLDVRKANDQAIHAVLLELFQQRDPKMTELPFGTLGARQVLGDALVAMGFQYMETGGDARPPAKARKTQSGRSTSSRRSSRSSASRTKKS